MKKYSSTKCPFCKNKLPTNTPWRYCKDLKCSKKYSYCFDCNLQYCWFVINNYEFKVFSDRMEIQELRPEKIKIDRVLNINSENYLQQIDRIKKLQTFK